MADACPLHVWLMQGGRELLSSFERQLAVAGDLSECAGLCLQATNDQQPYVCSAFAFDSAARTCLLYDHPAAFEPDWEATITKHSSASLYTKVCLIDKGKQFFLLKRVFALCSPRIRICRRSTMERLFDRSLSSKTVGRTA